MYLKALSDKAWEATLRPPACRCGGGFSCSAQTRESPFRHFRYVVGAAAPRGPQSDASFRCELSSSEAVSVATPPLAYVAASLQPRLASGGGYARDAFLFGVLPVAPTLLGSYLRLGVRFNPPVSTANPFVSPIAKVKYKVHFNERCVQFLSLIHI